LLLLLPEASPLRLRALLLPLLLLLLLLPVLPAAASLLRRLAPWPSLLLIGGVPPLLLEGLSGDPSIHMLLWMDLR
jgi:hypothetical protein